MALLLYSTNNYVTMLSGVPPVLFVLATAPKRVTREDVATYIIPAISIFVVGLGVIRYVVDPSHPDLFLIVLGGMLLLPQARHSRVDAYVTNGPYLLVGVGLANIVYGIVAINRQLFMSIFVGMGVFACFIGSWLVWKRR